MALAKTSSVRGHPVFPILPRMETPPFATSVDSVTFGHTSIRGSFRAVNSVPVRQLLTASRMEPLPSVTPKIRSRLDLLPSASVLGKTSHMETLPSASVLGKTSHMETLPSASVLGTTSHMETLPSATFSRKFANMSQVEPLPSVTLNNRSLLEPPPSVSSFVTSSQMETLPSATLYIPPHRRHSP